MSCFFRDYLNEIVHGLTKNRHIHGAVFHVQNTDKSIDILSAAGNLQAGSAYFIASINKLMISAIVLRLHENGHLHLDQKMHSFFDPASVKKLHVFEGQDFTEVISIRHLLSHTSGLPCYLIDKDRNGVKNMKLLQQNHDPEWPVERVVEEMKMRRAKFKPGTPGKAAYSETNFLLLSSILEKVTGKGIQDILMELFAELGMNNTFTLPAALNQGHAPVYFKDRQISLVNYWKSTRHNVASSAHDQMIFLRAFFEGYFFPANRIEECKQWNRIFMPFRYGVGIQEVHLPAIFTLFSTVPEIIGHCGSIGTFAFKLGQNLFVTGTINQSAKPQAAIQALFRIYRGYTKYGNQIGSKQEDDMAKPLIKTR